MASQKVIKIYESILFETDNGTATISFIFHQQNKQEWYFNSITVDLPFHWRLQDLKFLEECSIFIHRRLDEINGKLSVTLEDK